MGAIIGTKGSHIRNIIGFSKASVKIAPLEQEKQAEAANNPQQERKVTIVGSPEAQWKVYIARTQNNITRSYGSVYCTPRIETSDGTD